MVSRGDQNPPGELGRLTSFFMDFNRKGFHTKYPDINITYIYLRYLPFFSDTSLLNPFRPDLFPLSKKKWSPEKCRKLYEFTPYLEYCQYMFRLKVSENSGP